MSWDPYLAFAGGIHGAAIFGDNGALWATRNIDGATTDVKAAGPGGFKSAGEKLMFVNQLDLNGSTIFVFRNMAKANYGAVVLKTAKTIVMCTHSDAQTSAQCVDAAQKVAGALASVGY